MKFRYGFEALAEFVEACTGEEEITARIDGDGLYVDLSEVRLKLATATERDTNESDELRGRDS